jgi:hypothetical protein
MKLYEINDQCNRWESLLPSGLWAILKVFQDNFPNWRVEMQTLGIYRVSKPTPLGPFKLPIGKTIFIPGIFKFDISIIYPAIVQDPDIPLALKEECLKHLVECLGPPDS